MFSPCLSDDRNSSCENICELPLMDLLVFMYGNKNDVNSILTQSGPCRRAYHSGFHWDMSLSLRGSLGYEPITQGFTGI